MRSGIRTGIIVVLFILAVMGGAYFAGWLALTLVPPQSPTPLTWHIWWQYFQAIAQPQWVPYAHKIKMAGAFGFGLPLLAWAFLLIPIFKSKAEALHGDASFAEWADLKKAGLLKKTPQSILIGKYKGHYLWLGGAQHVIAVAPTRSGKTTSIAIPVLTTYEHSMVVLDLKGELRKATSGQRLAMGQRIYVWAPYDDEGRTHRFNPFTLLAGMDQGKRIGEVQTIAAILYPDEPGKDPFWTSQSRAAFTAFASFMLEAWDQLWQKGLPSHPNIEPSYPSFERILRFSAGEQGMDTKQMLQSILDDVQRFGYISTPTRTIFSNLVGLAEQTFSSVIATMQAPLQQFLSPTLAAATNATDLDITTIRKQPTTLYVDIPTNKLDESGKLLNIFFSTVIGNNLTKQLGDDPSLKYQMLMLMDEFTAMGRVDVWAKRISISASYGVRDLCIVQSRAQLRSAYGDNDAQNFITNHGAQVVFTPREQSDATEYSEMLGYKTIRKENRSRSTGGGGGSQVSISYSEERRALFLPQEIKELPNDDELIFYEGCKPIRAKKNWFFKDKALLARTKLAPVVIEPIAKRLAANKENTASPAVRSQTAQGAELLTHPQKQDNRDSHVASNVPPSETLKAPIPPALAPPPIPTALREALHDYPAYLQQVQQILNGAVSHQGGAISPYKQAASQLTDMFVALTSDVDNEIKQAQTSDHPEVMASMQKKCAWLTLVGQAINDALDELSNYFDADKDDSMKFHQIVAAAIMPLAVAAGCSLSHGDPNNPKRNPHPVRRYEVTAVADAPGAWDSVKGYASYEVVNIECTPENKFVGVHMKPKDVSVSFEMTRVADNTWKGYFYRDAMLDEDYYDLGVCRWDATQVAPSFVIRGVAFGASEMTDEALKAPQTTYFKKSDFLDHVPKPYGAADFSADRPEYKQHPNAFFPIIVTVSEVSP